MIALVLRYLFLFLLACWVSPPQASYGHTISLGLGLSLRNSLAMDSDIKASSQQFRLAYRSYGNYADWGSLGLGLDAGLHNLEYKIGKAEKSGYELWFGLSLAKVFKLQELEQDISLTLIPYCFFNVAGISTGRVNDRQVKYASALQMQGHLGFDLSYLISGYFTLKLFGKSLRLKGGGGLGYIKLNYSEKAELSLNSRGQNVSKKEDIDHSSSALFALMQLGVVL